MSADAYYFPPTNNIFADYFSFPAPFVSAKIFMAAFIFRANYFILFLFFYFGPKIKPADFSIHFSSPFPIFIFETAKMEEGMGAGQYYFSASKQTPK